MGHTTFTTDPAFLADETLHEAYELNIANKSGDPVRFGELVAGKGDSVTTLVIFGEIPDLNAEWLEKLITTSPPFLLYLRPRLCSHFIPQDYTNSS